jgi:hypothetical protein
MNEHSEQNTTHSIGKLTVMKILSETNFADNYAFLIIKNCTIILGSYRHKTSKTFILAEIIVQIHSMADTNIKIHTK